ncbi:aminopeptidase N-like [Teleopsis dalmanni]|uniref:aminopeptidase N-like n=1 Tax=Teleopsis dalmanni TaxID=139649 RepID=UPI0018CC9760|nr:aminopeptidase N-like [Teleopsis dalmanni]
MFLQLLIICVSITGFALGNTSIDEYNNVSKTPNYDHYRLPTSIRPKKYNLQVVTHLSNPNNLTFVGDVIMHLIIAENTNNITIHSQNLTIDEKQISLKNLLHNDRQNCISSTEVNPQHDYYIMHLCKQAKQGEEYILTIPFAGILNHKLRGYYRSSYHDKTTNKTRWLSVTQFEPAAARAAFPCFDEPDYKATFTVMLGHHKNYTALSNMPLREARPMHEQKDWLWSEFEESVPMSTYLVAYTVNDFAYVRAETNLKNNVQFRTWARRDAIDQCNYAGIVGPKVLEYYEEIFNIKFPLAKIDQIAIPDFSAGAMENWGLVTYRETALLYAANVSSVANKQRVASVIAHELAHQWFGNLVTMKWWTDLWLNEGFATYIASLGLEHISPEWKSLIEESVDNTLAIFKVDALKTSHPISQPIHHVSQISEIFDSISYKKGSAVLRMMHLFLGDLSFRTGVSNYLRKHAYSNAEQDNLWAALTESAHKFRAIPTHFNIKLIMDSWTLQTGYPVITVSRDYKRKTAEVSQTRYLLDTESGRTDKKNCWWVPLSYTLENQADFSATTPKDWLECESTAGAISKTLENMPNDNEWIIFNIQMAGLYKVKYDDHNWNMLIDTLLSSNFEKIHIINRAQLIDDALSLAWSGDVDYDVAMRLIEYLTREREYIPWIAALENLSNVNRILRQTPDYEFFKKYMRKILTPIYIYLNGLNETTRNPDEDNHSAILHKVLIAGWSCRFEVHDCIARARTYFKLWRRVEDPDKNNPIPTDLRSVVYCTAMRHGNDDDWHFLWLRYKNSNVAAEKKTIISALGCTREVWLLQRYLEWSFDETSHIRKQDSFYAFGSVARGEVGFHLAKDYFLSNIEFLHDFYEPDSSDLARLLTPLASQMASQRDYEYIKSFAEQNKKYLHKAEQSVRRALETIQINAQWKNRNYNEISERLRSRLL